MYQLRYQIFGDVSHSHACSPHMGGFVWSRIHFGVATGLLAKLNLPGPEFFMLSCFIPAI